MHLKKLLKSVLLQNVVMFIVFRGGVFLSKMKVIGNMKESTQFVGYLIFDKTC